ncbi:sensor histidine kinase [Parapedobacter tibetensis]|uniref:sensor histidine kinase n=1 Tax=Parapedobacter tibetensis TaxID=2972951 RepID=UPI00214DD8DB|nr:ATP-binding protein [Parapedobacter tibetensis]
MRTAVKHLCRLPFIFMVVLLFSSNLKAQISDEFYRALPKEFRPEDPSKLTPAEKRVLLDGANIRFHLKAFNPELDSIATALYAEVDQLRDQKDRIASLWVISKYTRNRFEDLELMLLYINRLIKEINHNDAFSAELCTALLMKGTVLLESGEMEPGLFALQEAEKMIRDKENIHERERLGYIYSAMSRAYIQLELYDQTIAYINLANPYFSDVKPEQSKNITLAHAELLKASAYIGSFQKKNQSTYLDTSLAIIRKLMHSTADDPKWNVLCYELLGKISYFKKDYRQSMIYLDSADLPKYAKLALIDHHLPERMAFRGLNLLHQSNTKAGDSLIKKAINLNNEMYSPISALYYQFYQAYRDIGDWENASGYLEKYIDRRDSIDIIQKNIAFADINEKYKSAQKEAQIQQLEIDREVQKKQQRLTLLLAIIAVLSLLLVMLLIHLFTKKKQQELENENLRIAQSLTDQETKMIEERYESLRLLRLEISNDMHNELGGALVSLNFYINDVQNAFKDKKVAEALNNIKEEANSIYIQTRDYIHALQENAKDIKFDLVNFLLYLPLHFDQRTTLKVRTDVEADPLESRLTVQQNNEFYLLIKEALANILKHANATYFTIKIDFLGENCLFVISDNGKGFDHGSTSSGMGIKNMKERIANLNGELTIESDKKGTILSGSFPVSSLSK